jgi:N-acylneuraminate cytidylyltransferase
MDVLAVIAAADRDVLRPVAGRPLIAYSVEQARAARWIARVAVVTPVLEVARIASELGADVVEVSGEPGAALTAAAALARAAEALADRDGFVPQAACILDPAYPLRRTDTLDGAVDHLFRCGADSLISVHELADALWIRDEGGAARLLDAPPGQQRYVDNGAILAVRMGVFEPGEDLPAGRTVLYEIPPLDAFRIHVAEDWLTAEAMLRSVHDVRAATLLKPIRLLALDFDGVMTDNRVLVFDDGREAVLCSRGDGLGFDRLREIGFPVVVISKEGNPVVAARCGKLKIPFEQGIGDKLPVLEKLVQAHGLQLDQVAYMGNDINDLDCMRSVRLAIAPCDAQPEVLQVAALVTRAPGGVGAVREICDAIVAANAAPTAD